MLPFKFSSLPEFMPKFFGTGRGRLCGTRARWDCRRLASDQRLNQFNRFLLVNVLPIPLVGDPEIIGTGQTAAEKLHCCLHQFKIYGYNSTTFKVGCSCRSCIKARLNALNLVKFLLSTIRVSLSSMMTSASCFL